MSDDRAVRLHEPRLRDPEWLLFLVQEASAEAELIEDDALSLSLVNLAGAARAVVIALEERRSIDDRAGTLLARLAASFVGHLPEELAAMFAAAVGASQDAPQTGDPGERPQPPDWVKDVLGHLRTMREEHSEEKEKS